MHRVPNSGHQEHAPVAGGTESSGRPLVSSVAIILLLAGLTVAHVAALERGNDLVGPLLILEHLFDLALVAGLVAIGVALGCLLLRKSGFSLTEPMDALAFGAAVGLAALSTTFLFVGFLGGLRGPILAAILVAAAGLARRELRGLPGLLARIPGSVAQGGGDRTWLAGTLAVTGLIAVFLLAFGAAPPTDWDSLMYHLQVPAAFLEAGRLIVPPDNLHVTLIGLAQFFYLPLLAAGSRAGPALLSALLALILGGTVFRAGWRLFQGEAGSLALTLFWGSTTILLVAVTPRVDVTLALYLFLAHYALLVGLEATKGSNRAVPGAQTDAGENQDPLRWTGLAAVLLGLAAGIKLNALAYAVALAPLVIWVLYRRLGGWKRILRPLAVAGLLGGLALAPWLLKNTLLVGAPLYPFFTARVAAPWLDALFPGGSAAAVVGPETLRLLRAVQESIDPWSAFFNPSGLNVEHEGAFYYTNWAFLLLPVGLLLYWKGGSPRGRSTAAWLAVPALAYVALALSLEIPNLRYLVPAAPALTLAVSWILLEISRRWAGGGIGKAWVVLACVMALLPTAGTVMVWTRSTAALRHLVGSASAEEYLSTHVVGSVRSYSQMVRYVNRNLPADSRVLMIFEARGAALQREVLQDNKISNWPILAAAAEKGGCLAEAGFDHVLVAPGAIDYYQQRGLDREALRWDDFQAYENRCLEEVWQTEGYQLYKLREQPGF